MLSPDRFVNAGESDERLPEFSVSATIPAGHVQLFHAAGAQALAHKRVHWSIAILGVPRFDRIFPSHIVSSFL